MPTLLPACQVVPPSRAMMLPASTLSPPAVFKPRRRPAESRPLREDPPAFLCAIALLSNSDYVLHRFRDGIISLLVAFCGRLLCFCCRLLRLRLCLGFAFVALGRGFRLRLS